MEIVGRTIHTHTGASLKRCFSNTTYAYRKCVRLNASTVNTHQFRVISCCAKCDLFGSTVHLLHFFFYIAINIHFTHSHRFGHNFLEIPIFFFHPFFFYHFIAFHLESAFSLSIKHLNLIINGFFCLTILDCCC